MHKKVQKTSAKAIFFQDEKILFVKDHKGSWELPGGKIEFNEDIETTLKRECSEELGFNNVEIGNIVDAWTFSSTVKDVDYHFILLIYTCSTTEKKLKCSNEHEEYAWISFDKINDLNMRENYKKSIIKYRKLNNI